MHQPRTATVITVMTTVMKTISIVMIAIAVMMTTTIDTTVGTATEIRAFAMRGRRATTTAFSRERGTHAATAAAITGIGIKTMAKVIHATGITGCNRLTATGIRVVIRTD